MKPIPKELELKIDEVRKWIFDGDQDRVAAKSRKSREYVNKVLNKKAFNPIIMKAALEVMHENKADFEIQDTYMKAS